MSDTDNDPNSFECDDCNLKGTNWFEEIGLTLEEANAYIELGEPDRCEECFIKWRDSAAAAEYLDILNDSSIQ